MLLVWPWIYRAPSPYFRYSSVQLQGSFFPDVHTHHTLAMWYKQVIDYGWQDKEKENMDGLNNQDWKD